MPETTAARPEVLGAAQPDSDGVLTSEAFDLVLNTLSHGEATTSAMADSTESARFA